MLLWLLRQAPTDRVNPINVTLTAVYRSIDSSLASDARTIQFGGYPALELKAAVEVEAIIPLFVAGDVTQGCPLHHLIRSRKEARATAWSRLDCLHGPPRGARLRRGRPSLKAQTHGAPLDPPAFHMYMTLGTEVPREEGDLPSVSMQVETLRDSVALIMHEAYSTPRETIHDPQVVLP